jgi:hypothetical protein
VSKENNITTIQNACVLLASYQWLLYTYPHLMIKLQVCTTVLSDMYPQLPTMLQFWPTPKKKAAMTFGAIPL